MSGIVSVRAYGAQAAFKAESLKRIDHYSRIKRAAYSLNRWISVRIDLLGQIFTVALASYLVYGHSIGASNTGFTLNLAVDFCSVILWWVRIFNEFEVQSNRYAISFLHMTWCKLTPFVSVLNAFRITSILNMSPSWLRKGSRLLHGQQAGS